MRHINKEKKAAYDKEYTARPEIREKRQKRYLKIRETEEYKESHRKRNRVYKSKFKNKLSDYYNNRYRWMRIKQKYGITKEQWFNMYETQNGKCKVCGRELKLGGKRTGLSVMTEHCHRTGRVRGLTCNYCNSYILPFFDYDNERISNLKNYLETDFDGRLIDV